MDNHQIFVYIICEEMINSLEIIKVFSQSYSMQMWNCNALSKTVYFQMHSLRHFSKFIKVYNASGM